ncbi:MAG: bis(5'-nucleosyl)-tetraphosphatase (symmetrical) YqeK [Thermaerobacter sp.]|nr:bis(5'-nucleosyl)-tetraphosphatase (symmetrical) YqeK [Thermaerobacter sp.]
MLIEERFQRLTPHRREHIERVTAVMESLAHAHHLDRDEARLAGFGHDLAREMSRLALLDEARRLGLRLGREEEQEPVLLHGPVAAAWLEQAGRGTPSVWEAIRYHTTGAPHLNALGRALYIADGVEPGRQYPERQKLLDLALMDLDAGYCEVLRHTVVYLKDRGFAPHPDMLSALDGC